MYGFFVFVHILVCVGLILVVLFQAGKGGGLGNIFGGGGGGDQLFSAPSGSAFIRKVTTAMAIVFVCTSIMLTIMSSRRSQSSLMERMPAGGSPNSPVGP